MNQKKDVERNWHKNQLIIWNFKASGGKQLNKLGRNWELVGTKGNWGSNKKKTWSELWNGKDR